MENKVYEDMEVLRAIYHALHTVDRIIKEHKGNSKLSRVKRKLQEAEFLLMQD